MRRSRKLALKKLACGVHGTKYFVFQRTGPCMHPDCAVERIRLWSKTNDIAAQVFRPVMGDLYDFVVWGMTEGEKYIQYRWGAMDAWMSGVSAYRRKKKIENIEAATATENDKLLFLANSKGSNGTGNNAGKTVYPDAHLWVRECAQFLEKQYSHSMVAYFLDIIDLFDLAKLCYSGDIIKTKSKIKEAKLVLKEWCFGG